MNNNKQLKLINQSFLCLAVAVVFSLIFITQVLADSREIEFDETNSENQEREELDINNENKPEKFSNLLHPDDHGIYAGRSLMSQANIEHQHDKDAVDERDFEPLKTIDFAEKEWQLMFRSIDSMSGSMFSSILDKIGKDSNVFDEVVSRLKPECRREIYHVRDSMKQHKLWALKMIDSTGKLPSGVTYGRFSSPGDYEECLAVKVNELIHRANHDGNKLKEERHKFIGKYCLLDFRLPVPDRPRDKLLSIHEPVLNLSNTEIASIFPEINNYSAYASVFYEVGYLHAFCIPSTCDVEDLRNSLAQTLEGLHILVNSTIDCQMSPEEGEPLTMAQIISISLLVLLFLNAALASITYTLLPNSLRTPKDRGQNSQLSTGKLIEMQMASKKPGIRRWAMTKAMKHGYYVDCFSIQSNFERLTKPDPRGLTFVHYTRIVAMALTVITHTAAMGTLQAITKPADASSSHQIFRDFLPQMLANAFSSIQIFFFMAGFMLVISTYPSIKRDPSNLSFLEYAIKRAIRLMPGLAATIASNFIWPLLVDGPMLNYFIRIIVKPCETNWWRTMAFLSNFDHVEQMCLRHSYFSASDYQLHMMAFPLLILLNKKPALSLILAALLTIMGFAAQVIMVLTKTLLPFIMIDYIDKEAFYNIVHYIHHPVWNHMGAFFYGFIVGYFVVKQIRINISERTTKIIWLITIPSGLVAIYAPYYWNHYSRPIYRWQMVLYVLIDRFVLLTTCAWLSYATMVLARPKKQKTSRKQTNLPKAIALKTGEKAKESLDEAINGMVYTADESGSNKLDIQSHLSVGSGSIPRQRSSPNVLAITSLEQGCDSPAIRPAISSSDVNLITKDCTNQPAPDPEPKNLAVSGSESSAASRRPVSNVNTLCLMLSRLTFQLYLFNMVVLWVDVNHSKYFWYFSYYFIFTKAFAVYIFSTIMAMIFFVTLESPCLTLYIMWVKSRAQARGKMRAAAAEKSLVAQDLDVASSTSKAGIKYTNEKSSPQSRKQMDPSSEGLHMRIGTPVFNKPTFSFIDLSTTPSEMDVQNNLTKM